MTPRLGRLLTLLALGTLLGAVVPSPSASQTSPPLSTRQHDTEEPVVLRLHRLEVRCHERVPTTCGLPAGSDLAVLHFVVRNRGASPYSGHVNLFSLLTPPATTGGQPAFREQIHPEVGACGAVAAPRYPIETGFDPPLAAGRSRRFHTLFALPRGEVVARIIYNDDDIPTCLSVPRITYSDRACRPRPRRVGHVPCDFFER